MKKAKKRKDGRYATSITIGIDESGKPIKHFVYGKTLKEFEQNKLEALMSLKGGTFIKNKQVLFDDYAKKWLKSKQISISNATHEMYTSVIRSNLKAFTGHLIKDISKSDIQELINEYKDKRRTCEKIIITLNQIFDSALEDELITKNPCKKIELPAKTYKEKRPLTSQEDQLSELAEFTPRERCYVLLIKYYGFRKQEALALSRKRFNFEEKTITLKDAIEFISNKAHIKETKTVSGERIVPILSKDLDFFREYCDHLQSEWLFTSLSSGELISSQSFRRMYESILNKMNKKADELKLPHCDNLTSHVYRHNYSTMLYNAKLGLKESQYLMGHKNIKTTMEIYTHLDKENTHKSVGSKIEEFLEKK